MRFSCLPLTMEVWVQSQASMWKLWLTKWHWDRLPSKYFNISYEWHDDDDEWKQLQVILLYMGSL
jgi:hypothetical protein